MDVILAIILVTAINVGAADRALADPTGKCAYHINPHGQQVPHPCGNRHNSSERPPDAAGQR